MVNGSLVEGKQPAKVLTSCRIRIAAEDGISFSYLPRRLIHPKVDLPWVV